MMNDKKFAVITGGSSGIGVAVARELVELGYNIILVSRRLETLEEIATGLKRPGNTVKVICSDVAMESDVVRMQMEIEAITDKVDVLFNNAGSGEALGLQDTTLDIWNKTIGSSLTGTFLSCRALLPLLRASSNALIINNSSIAAHRGFPNFTAYSAAKGGVLAFSRALREEVRAEGIRVVTLSPGATDTPFWDNVKGEWDRSKMIPVDDLARIVRQVVESPRTATIEDIVIMPAGGAL